jgi:hypothetical protein
MRANARTVMRTAGIIIPSSKHGVRSKVRMLETGPQPSAFLHTRSSLRPSVLAMVSDEASGHGGEHTDCAIHVSVPLHFIRMIQVFVILDAHRRQVHN